MDIRYAKMAVKRIGEMDKLTKQRIKQAIEKLPRCDVKRFLPQGADDFVTEEDQESHRLAMQEYMRGETTAHDAVDWDS